MLPVYEGVISLGLKAGEEVLETFQNEAHNIPSSGLIIILDKLVTSYFLEGSCHVLVVV